MVLGNERGFSVHAVASRRGSSLQQLRKHLSDKYLSKLERCLDRLSTGLCRIASPVGGGYLPPFTLEPLPARRRRFRHDPHRPLVFDVQDRDPLRHTSSLGVFARCIALRRTPLGAAVLESCRSPVWPCCAPPLRWRRRRRPASRLMRRPPRRRARRPPTVRALRLSSRPASLRPAPCRRSSRPCPTRAQARLSRRRRSRLVVTSAICARARATRPTQPTGRRP